MSYDMPDESWGYMKLKKYMVSEGIMTKKDLDAAGVAMNKHKMLERVSWGVGARDMNRTPVTLT